MPPTPRRKWRQGRHAKRRARQQRSLDVLVAGLRHCRALLESMSSRRAVYSGMEMTIKYDGDPHLLWCSVDDDCEGAPGCEFYQFTISNLSSGAGLSMVFVSERPDSISLFCEDDLHPHLKIPESLRCIVAVEMYI